MSFIKYLLIVLATIAIVLFAVNSKVISFYENSSYNRVIATANSAKLQFIRIEQSLTKQLISFSQIVANDMDFAMALTVDQDFTSPAISEFTLKYLSPMQFKYLEILDSNYTILSSAHFPAGNGNIDISKKGMQENTPILMLENIRGKESLTLQIKIPFNCSGVKLFCIGGVTVDSTFLSNIVSNSDSKAFIEIADKVYGDNIKSISPIKNHSIVIDNIEYIATTIPLTHPNSPKIIVTANKSKKVTLFNLLR